MDNDKRVPQRFPDQIMFRDRDMRGQGEKMKKKIDEEGGEHRSVGGV
jgi:hypothetical protein